MRDVAIVSAVRTAIGKGGKGTLKDTRPDTLAGHVLRAAVERSGVKPADIEEVTLGCAMPEAEQGMNVARIAMFLAGLPETTSAATLNRFCSSGLNAVADVAKSIMVGQIELGIGGGVESMSLVPMGGHKPSANPELMEEHPGVYTPMGITAENVANKFGVSRADQDAFALESHKRASNAIEKGLFKDEIVSVDVDVWDESGKKHRVSFAQDEGPRPDSTLEALAKLRPVFDAKGSVTAGNSSQVSDGAAAVVLTSVDYAKTHGIVDPVRVAAVSTVTPTFPNTVIDMPLLSTDSSAITGVPDRTFKESIGQAAYEEAGIGPDDVDVAEVYDLSTALELDWIEDLQLCGRGEAEALLRAGDTTIGGRIPVNPSGGLACFGEAVPAQAIAQVCELTWQLRGQATGRQVEGARVGITANQGLFGHGSSVLLVK